MEVRFVIIAIILSSCSCATRNVDPRFEPYIQEYKDEAAVYDIKIDDSRLTAFETIYIRDGYEGYCINLAHNPWLRLKKDTFQYLSDNSKRMLLFHELTHCFVKGRAIFHNNETMNTSWNSRMPKSILNQLGLEPDSLEFERYKECYMYELFHNSYLLKPECFMWFDDSMENK